VAESLLAFECETLQVIRTNPGAPSGGNVVLGTVVAIHVAEGLVDERHRVDPAGLDAVGRMGGLSYCLTRDRFELPMGRKALE
jgi:flavin reductase (DIM6/NTAB) family NADH-FMN oxidoreductase RutF